MTSIRLIVGLGNHGAQYEATRHNAGAWFVERLVAQHGWRLTPESKLFGLVARGDLGGHDVRCIIPSTFMNRSGQAVAAMCQFYKIQPHEVLVAHDELDLPPGQIRLKTGGGHGGHNGLRDTISSLGNQQGFHRLRIGIGHPGQASLVSGFVLGKAPSSEQQIIDQAIDEALRLAPQLVQGEMAKAMNQLNSFKASL